MPRKQLLRTDKHPYHITIRTNNREWFDLPLSDVWEICISALKYAQHRQPVKIQAFVLMSNHYHLMLWTPNSDLDRFMFFLNMQISKGIREKTGRINRVFGDRYKWSVIKDRNYYYIVLRYIYQNPLRANIITKCEDYKFSTLYYHYRKLNFDINLFEPTHGDEKNFMKWINNPSANNTNLQTAKALSRPVFKIPVASSSRRYAVAKQKEHGTF